MFAARVRGTLAAVAVLLAGCTPAADTPAPPPAAQVQHAPAPAQSAAATKAGTAPTAAQSAADSATAADDVRLAQLPPEARDTLQRIRSGGPFAYDRDGTVFGNREGHLPKRPRGYYTEYTVRTPGARDRGARRIVAGRGATGDPATGGEYYYTGDHYNSFRRIRE